MPDKVSNIDDLKELGEGKLDLKVYDENDNLKDRKVYTRVKGDGSVEVKKEGNAPVDAGSEDVGSEASQGGWVKTRRDKLPFSDRGSANTGKGDKGGGN